MTFGALQFVHLHLFDREWSDLDLGDDDLRALQNAIATAPTRPRVIPGAGGLRKIRFAAVASARGKSGSYRVGYAYFPAWESVVLITVWGKNERANLSRADCNAVSRILREIEKEWRQQPP